MIDTSLVSPRHNARRRSARQAHRLYTSSHDRVRAPPREEMTGIPDSHCPTMNASKIALPSRCGNKFTQPNGRKTAADISATARPMGPTGMYADCRTRSVMVFDRTDQQ